MNKILLLFCVCITSTTLFAQSKSIYFADFPSLTPDGETILFSHNDDLWSVPANGGLASRLTAMDGKESKAKVSPDGKWIAFTGTQYGNEDVYIMPFGGGPIQQLTFHDGYDEVASWSWDGKSIYFTSNRYNRMSTYQVAIEGGTPKRVFEHYFNNIHNLFPHPNGTFYFNETWESSNFEHRKRYKGPYNPDIKSYDPKTKTFKVHTDYEGKDFAATIDKQGNVYFLSDEYNGEYNLYTFKKGKKTRLTKFDSAVRFPQVSANGEKIVFQKDYQLYIYDVKKGAAKLVPITVLQNNTLAKTQDFNVSGKISFFDVSNDGKKLCFVSRGELFVSDIKGKFVKQLKTKADGRVLEAYFLKDDKTILFSQTVKGYQNWYTIPASGKEVETQRTNDAKNNRNIAFNSDQTKAVYLSGRSQIRELDLESFRSTLLLTDELWGFYNDVPVFSPDDKHLLFTAYRNFERDIFLYTFETKEKRNLTNTGITEAAPFWSPDGKYIYFYSDRLTPSYPYGLRNPKIYRLALQDFDTPYRSDKFDELFPEEEPKDTSAKKDEKKEKKEKEEKKVAVVIDFEDLSERIEQIGPRFGSQSSPYVIQKDDKTMIFYSSNHDEGKSNLWKTTYEPFEKTKTEKISGANSGSVAIEASKNKYYYLSRGTIHELKVSSNSVEKIAISHTFRRQLKAEFEQMFYETWANLNENFYNETFHGVDWPAMRDRYATFLPHLNTRGNLRRVLNDMMGELNTSHFGFSSNGKEEKPFYGTRTLGTGLLFSEEQPFVIRHIIEKGPADKKEVDLKPGDKVVKINGAPVDPTMNREFYFSQPSIDKELVLTIDRYGEEKVVKLHPTSSFSMRSLLYNEWMADCQERVDKASNKRIAYVHMKNMGRGELNHFREQMIAEGHNKDALILDLRYNTGGNVHDLVLQFLARKPYLQWKYREGELTQQPNFTPAVKPIVLLINEQSLSDAEMTSEGFKQLELGTVIGMPTYRWIIFTSGKGLVDGSFYRLPSWGCYTLDGKNLEKTGVSPDITVNNTFKDRLEGKDPQLDRAIQEIMKQLQRK